SHILIEVEKVADSVAIVYRGRLLVSDEIDRLKQTEKLVKVIFDNEVAVNDLLKIPGVVQAREEGKAFRLSVRGDLEGVLAVVRRYPVKTLEVIDLNLEDIFMERVKGVA
ncbi:MAG: ABC transporter ATP-binding protein, partial [Dehalococcoidia bacterium]|nr:ABC transporter ATP-binding protein [Dehalococcoidia bacterium]